MKFLNLSNKQLNRLAEFTSNLSLVFFAGFVIPLFTGIDKIHPISVLLGVLSTIVCLAVSVFYFERK